MKNERKRTIRTDLFMILMLGLVLPSALMTLLYSNSMRGIIDDKVVAYQRVIVDQAAGNLENLVKNAKTVQRIAISKIISDYIPLEPHSHIPRESVAKLKGLIEHLSVLDIASPYINGIYIILDSGYVISSRISVDVEALLSQDCVVDARTSGGEEIFTPVRPAGYNAAINLSEPDRVVSFLQKVDLTDGTGRFFVVMIDINLASITDILDSVEYNEQIPVVIENEAAKTIIAGNTNYLDFVKQKNNVEVSIDRRIVEGPFLLHAYLRKDQISKIFAQAVMGTVGLSLVLILVGFFAAFFLSRSITTPLHQLYLCMRQIGRGDFNPEYPATVYNEIQYLIERFSTMVREIDQLIDTVVRKEKETIDAELDALQARINPHFLYNTLDVIRGMALEDNNDKIAEMALALSRMFRYVVNQAEGYSTLDKELKHIDDYLRIQRYRFGDRIQVITEIEHQALNARLIRFMLQPVIENAYKHGLEFKESDGRLRIAAATNEKILTILVEDNGSGMPEQELDFLKAALEEAPNVQNIKKAHGLENVNLRIKLTYGAEYGIELDSRREEGMRVILRLPYSREPV